MTEGNINALIGAAGAVIAALIAALVVWLTQRKPWQPPPPAPIFTRWDGEPGVMQGATNRSIRLEKVPRISKADWKLLSRLRFWLIAEGKVASTFGYKESELTPPLREPLANWIALATGPGEGLGVRRPRGVEVVRVNVAAENITIL